MIGFFILAIETQNVCAVNDWDKTPLPIVGNAKEQENSKANIVNSWFQTLLVILMVSSSLSSVSYINKVYKVWKYHDKEIS